MATVVAQAALRLMGGPHPERARLDAEALLLHLVGRNRAWLLTHGDDEFGGCTAIQYAGLIERRLRGEPIQYITGRCEFFGLRFRVTRDVLIPRPETEHLVEQAIATFRDKAAPRILDIGTGSGAIAVALAHALPHAQVTAVDVSPGALEVARGNAEQNGVAERVRFLESDLLSAVAEETFDGIVSNPPYVPESDEPTLAVEVREHEPALALFAGEDGLAMYRRLIPAAACALAPDGWLIVEIGYGQADAVQRLMVETGFGEPNVTADLQGISRVVAAKIPQATSAR